MPQQKTSKLAHPRLRVWLRHASNADLSHLAGWCRAEIAGEDHGIPGFVQFYRLVFGRELPRHAREEWLPAIYQARARGKGAVIQAFRGAAKTTTLSVAWVAFRIGHRPECSNLVIQAGDKAAHDTSQQIADLIAHSQAWRAVFPYVRPDLKQGWGAAGYEVMRTDLEYPGWRARCAQVKGKDPSLLGLGYRSRALIGKHPSGVLLIDDIHDENNTRSAKELAMVRQVVAGTILPTVLPETWQVVVGTPWVPNDVLAGLQATGRYLAVRTPLLRRGEIVWPERFSKADLEGIRQAVGEREFARMYLLDLDAASGAHLRRNWLHSYPAEKINPGWPVVIGVDYASTADQLTAGRRDFFAVAIGRALPGGAGVVLVDGFRGKVSQGEAELQLKRLAEQYPTTQVIGVEAVGKGEEFFHLMLRTSRLPLQPVSTGRSSKGERFEKGMAPLFQFRRAWVSDIETPFIRAFKDEWVRWPQGEHDDTLDAVYWMLYVGAPHLISAEGRQARQKNPFAELGRL
ncbi:MAG: hypothetical protein ABFS17_11420 [Chloroflexota bacterium]